MCFNRFYDLVLHLFGVGLIISLKTAILAYFGRFSLTGGSESLS